MKSKLLITAMLCLLSLVSTSMAEYAVTTADGSGADGGVSNDSNKTATWVGGAVADTEIRRYDTVRTKAAIVRFDLGSGIGGDSSGATLSITEISGNRGRTMNVYGLKDGPNDFWDEATISYATAPGLLNPDNSAYITIDPNEWALVGTMDFVDNRGDGLPVVITGLVDPTFLASDTNGAVSFLLYTSGSDNSHDYYVAMKENTNGYAYPALTFPNARFATDPIPDNGDTVLTTLSALSWTNTEPNDLVGGVITCDVYLGTDPNRLLMDKVTTTADVDSVAIDTTNFPNFGALQAGTYYWVVDSYDSSSNPSSLGAGMVWSFEVTSAPQVTGHPVDQIKAPGETAEFSVIVESTTTVTYTWYQSADNANDTSADDVVVGGNSDTLTLTGLSGSNEGYYYCKAVNSSGEANADYSDTASLVVRRQVAHWALDSLVSGQYEDSSGEGHHADPNNQLVTFVDGVNVATTNQGVVVNTNSAANAGTWDPSYVSGEFTFSLWMKWDGTGSGFRDILTKHNGWDPATTLWQFGLDSSNQLALIRAGGTNVYGQAVPADVWVYVAVTFDGSTATIYSFEVGSDDINLAVGEGAYSLGQMPDAGFNIGCYYNEGVPAELFPGILDEIQVFNYVKDAMAVADLYNEAVAQDFCLRTYGSADFDLDVNDNCRIDMADFAEFAKSWMECGLYPNCP